MKTSGPPFYSSFRLITARIGYSARHIFVGFVFALSAMTASAATSTKSVATEPVISKIRGRNIYVKVPEGFETVTLQRLVSPPKGRKSVRPAPRPEWKTASMKQVESSGTIVFRVPKLLSKRNLRVLGQRASSLPPAFQTGDTVFGADTGDAEVSAILSVNTTDIAASGGILTLNNADSLVTTTVATDVGTLTTATADSISTRSTTESSRLVSEADLWKQNGDRLYVFNQYRGLQVFNIANPDVPVLLGTLRMPASGEDMFLLDSNHVVLIKRTNQWMRIALQIPVFNAFPGLILIGNSVTSSGLTLADSNSTTLVQDREQAEAQHEIVVVNVADGVPSVTGSLEFTGNLRESRLVGEVLYLGLFEYDSEGTGHYGATVRSYDLADRANPVERQVLPLGGWTAAVSATENYFLTAVSGDNGGTTVHVVNISDASGLMSHAGSVDVAGVVRDKFKMHTASDVLTIVSEDATFVGWRRRPFTRVTTFDLSAPALSELGDLSLAANEDLYATRFDGDLLYIVTAERIEQEFFDPLWIISLADPADPTVLGHLEIPGFSTYIEPLGDRLLTIGNETNGQPIISLFDVSDAATPTEITRLQLTDSTSETGGSEALWNEKALSVVPSENLIMLPVQRWSRTGMIQGVQIVDLFTDKLVKRGLLRSDFSPRRVLFHNHRAVSVSERALTSISLENRNAPAETGSLEIAWPVTRVLALGDHLVQLTQRIGQPLGLSVSPSDDPDNIIGSLPLKNAPVVSLEVRDSILYVLQSVESTAEAQPNTRSAKPAEVRTRLVLSTVDLARMPAITLLRELELPSSAATQWSGTLAPAHWIHAGLLAWSFPKVERYNAHRGDYLGRTGQQVVAVDVTDPAAPRFVSDFVIGEGESWHVATPVALNGVLYASHRVLAAKTTADPVDTAEQAATQELGKHYLQLVRYDDPAKPAIDPAQPNIPGRLLRVASGGQILYTVGPVHEKDTVAETVPSVSSPNISARGILDCWVPMPYYISARPGAIHASAVDGATAHFLDQIPVPDRQQPVSFPRGKVVVFSPEPEQVWTPAPETGDGLKNGLIDLAPSVISTIWSGSLWANGSWEENPKLSSVASWTLNDAGKFDKGDELPVDHDSQWVLVKDLALTYQSPRSPRVLDLDELSQLGFFESEVDWANLGAADGTRDTGLWLPLGEYGVQRVGF